MSTPAVLLTRYMTLGKLLKTFYLLHQDMTNFETNSPQRMHLSILFYHVYVIQAFERPLPSHKTEATASAIK